ncbi:alpha/beta fold hydrolase [Altericroceibacterium spongiae]|uniref:Alpha/beta fold hydrolase n=1 Tax=Altericroceibacterium spongiae TaxID=2320269 RepID=A0A420EQY7_9SPHN|nr:alpha/beta fold hydrolase [Altericroceibacterium spongiae]RKF23089.1 alpha/beta fold hydrolase [Altericroceibacterium spongiae]
MSIFPITDRHIYYMRFGAGRPVLLLHGISNSGRAWNPQIPVFMAAGYEVIIPDLSGHGASGRLSAPHSVADLADDIEVLLGHLGIEDLDIIGLSLGGMIALELAARHRLGIGKLIVADSFDNISGEQFAAMAEGWAQIFEQPGGPVTRLEQQWPSLVSPRFQASPEGLQTWQVWHGIAASAHGPSLAHVARGIVGFDIRDRLGGIAVPTLFIGGSLDAMSPPAISEDMAQQVQNGRFICIDGAGHIANVDSARMFNDLSIRFLAEG